MSKKILIVDDNEFIVDVMTHILNNKGYDVIHLYDGEGVIRKINSDHPDLVILDVMLPGVDGRDICKMIKHNSETRDLPVIMCSGSSDDDMYTSFDQISRPNDVLQKPFDMNLLIEKVALQLAA